MSRTDIIYYNSIDVFTGQPTPFLTYSADSISTAGGTRVAQQNQITLNGQITGDTFTGLASKAEEIGLAFSTGFRNLKVSEFESETLVDVIEFSGCRVESVNFTESTVSRIIDYTINLSNYENFSGTSGVINPQESFNFSMSENGVSSMTHEISAEGVSITGENPFNNAKNHVLALSGWSNQITPQFVNGGSTVYPVLLSISESIDRLNSTYSLTENYSFEDGATGSQPFTTTTVSIDTSLETDFDTVSVESVVNGGKTFTTSQTLDHALSLDLFSVADSKSNIDNLLNNPTNFSLNQDQAANTVTVSISYDNNTIFGGTNAYFDYTVDVNRDNITDISAVTIQGEIFARGNRKANYSFAESFLTSTIENSSYLYTKANQIYEQTQSDAATFPLRKTMDTFSVTKNPNQGKISVSASFTNKDFIMNSSAEGNLASDINYSVSINAAIPQLRANQHLFENGYCVVEDLGARNRETVDFSININYNHCGNLSEAFDNNSRLAEITGNQGVTTKYVAEATANTVLSNIASGFIAMPFGAYDTVLISENMNYFEQTRTASAQQSYSQQRFNLGYNEDIYKHIQWTGPQNSY